MGLFGKEREPEKNFNELKSAVRNRFKREGEPENPGRRELLKNAGIAAAAIGSIPLTAKIAKAADFSRYNQWSNGGNSHFGGPGEKESEPDYSHLEIIPGLEVDLEIPSYFIKETGTPKGVEDYAIVWRDRFNPERLIRHIQNLDYSRPQPYFILAYLFTNTNLFATSKQFGKLSEDDSRVFFAKGISAFMKKYLRQNLKNFDDSIIVNNFKKAIEKSSGQKFENLLDDGIDSKSINEKNKEIGLWSSTWLANHLVLMDQRPLGEKIYAKIEKPLGNIRGDKNNFYLNKNGFLI
jgi:hypothetical protein